MVLLREPRFQGVSEGSREWFEIQREIIQSRPLMKHCYDIWYQKLLQDADRVSGHHGVRDDPIDSMQALEMRS